MGEIWRTGVLALCLLLSFSVQGGLGEESAAEETPPAEEEVVDNVIPIVAQNASAITEGQWIVMFYAPWCGHCKALKPEFAKLSSGDAVKQGPGMKLAKVDCTVWSGICESYGVTGYPGLKYFANGETFDYKGIRSFDGLVHYVNNLLAPNVPEFSAKDLRDVKKRGPEVRFTLAVGDGGDQEEQEEVESRVAVFKRAYLDMAGYGNLEFVICRDNSVLMTAKGKGSGSHPSGYMYVLVSDDVGQDIYQGPSEVGALVKWMESHRFLAVETISHHNFWAFSHQDKPMLVALIHGKRETELVEEAKENGLGDVVPLVAPLRKLAAKKELRERMVFGRLDGYYWVAWARLFGVESEHLPHIILYDAQNEYYWTDWELNTQFRQLYDATKEHDEEIARLIEAMVQPYLEGEPPIALAWYGTYALIRDYYANPQFFLSMSGAAQFGCLFGVFGLVAIAFRLCCGGSPQKRRPLPREGEYRPVGGEGEGSPPASPVQKKEN